MLEVKATQLALNTFLSRIRGESVVLMSDNVLVVAYLTKQGSTVLRAMCSLTQEVVVWSELHVVMLSARCTPQEEEGLGRSGESPRPGSFHEMVSSSNVSTSSAGCSVVIT